VKARLVATALALMLASTLAGVGCGSGSEESAAPADFYRGKTIDLIISASPGGRTDLIGRALASYLERDTGANVVVKNREGAGGLDGMNYLHGAEPDGLTLGVVASLKFVGNKILDEPAASYEIEEFSYVMSVGRRLYQFMANPDGPYQSVADLQAGEDLKLGGSSPSGPISLGSMTVIELLDLDAKVVTGLGSESARSLACKRGEIAGYAAAAAASEATAGAPLVEPMFTLATERGRIRPDVPAITELVDLEGQELALAELWETALVSSTMLAAPAGVPEDRLAFLRGLVEEWIQDEEFRDQMSDVSGYEVQEYATGATVASDMLDVSAALEDFRALFAEMIEKYRA
jgi:tripartite-type tricarboxylate transporter receptor subunit TctC